VNLERQRDPRADLREEAQPPIDQRRPPAVLDPAVLGNDHRGQPIPAERATHLSVSRSGGYHAAMMRTARLASSICVLGLLAISCSSSGPGAGAGGSGGSSGSGGSGGNGATVSQSISPDGGTLTTAQGVSVDVPAGALAAPTTLTVESMPSAIPSTGTVALTGGSATSAIAVGTPFVFGPEGTTFSVPVTVTLPFDATKLPTGKTSAAIQIATASVGTSAFTLLTTTVVDTSHVSAPTSHFSAFVPVVPQSSGGVTCGTAGDCQNGQVCVNGACQAG